MDVSLGPPNESIPKYIGARLVAGSITDRSLNVINSEILRHAAWRKSKRSDSQGGCVSVADLGSCRAIRDSKNPGLHVMVSPASWSTFIAWVLVSGDVSAKSYHD
ncbi:DUF397 domain-containing protein [Sphaerisporangium aureirubrum]|uniref:DUF397 domain-containing protein n=1 Tax=Sphaerisporangium aureirubrum TaxID=1544736 RepID=A0ABW1NQS1_9ACTN